MSRIVPRRLSVNTPAQNGRPAHGKHKHSQLVHVPQVCPTPARFNNSVVNVEIAIWLLRALDHTCQLADCYINLSIKLVLQKVAGAFYPFRNIAVPEQMERNRPHGLVIVYRMPFQLEAIVPSCTLQLRKLHAKGSARHNSAAALQERRTVELSLRKYCLRVCHDYRVTRVNGEKVKRGLDYPEGGRQAMRGMKRISAFDEGLQRAPSRQSPRLRNRRIASTGLQVEKKEKKKR